MRTRRFLLKTVFQMDKYLRALGMRSEQSPSTELMMLNTIDGMILALHFHRKVRSGKEVGK